MIIVVVIEQTFSVREWLYCRVRQNNILRFRVRSECLRLRIEMTDAEERKFLIQAVRLLRTVGYENFKLFTVVKYAKDVQRVIEVWEESKSVGVGMLVMKMRMGENTRHVLAQLIVTMLWSIPSLIPPHVAKGLCDASRQFSVSPESAFQDALKLLQNINPGDRVVLSQLLDLVADVAEFQSQKDSEAPLRLAKIFGPVLLRSASVDSSSIVATIITLTQNRKALHLSMSSSSSSSSSSSLSSSSGTEDVPVLVAEPVVAVPITTTITTPVVADTTTPQVAIPAKTGGTAPPLPLDPSYTKARDDDDDDIPSSVASGPPSTDSKVDDNENINNIKLPEIDFRSMTLPEHHAATERALNRVHQVLMGDTPEARARRLKRECERSIASSERSARREEARQEQQRRAASRAARRRAAMEERNRRRIERSEERSRK